jgi:hypothetical protein
MNHDFDTYVKEHLQEILCEAEKNHTLSLLNTARHSQNEHKPLKIHNQLVAP